MNIHTLYTLEGERARDVVVMPPEIKLMLKK